MSNSTEKAKSKAKSYNAKSAEVKKNHFQTSFGWSRHECFSFVSEIFFLKPQELLAPFFLWMIFTCYDVITGWGSLCPKFRFTQVCGDHVAGGQIAIHTMINSMFFGVTRNRLQSVQNAAVRLLPESSGQEQISVHFTGSLFILPLSSSFYCLFLKLFTVQPQFTERSF